jgi:hypothetical protein
MKSLLNLEVGNEYFVDMLYVEEFPKSRLLRLKYIKKYKKVGFIELYDVSANKRLKRYCKLDSYFMEDIIEKLDKKEFRKEKIKKLINDK